VQEQSPAAAAGYAWTLVPESLRAQPPDAPDVISNPFKDCPQGKDLKSLEIYAGNRHSGREAHYPARVTETLSSGEAWIPERIA
jgi:hypothetical protein